MSHTHQFRASRLRPLAGRTAAILAGAAAMALAVPAQAQFRQEIPNDMSRCDGRVPAVRVNVSGIESSKGDMRVQLYRAIKADWLESGRWIHRIEVPAKKGRMTFCLPVPLAGSYGVAIRHDTNGNGSTDITADGGGMSNNPSINIFNLGKPSYKKVAFPVDEGVTTINITMKYL